MRSEKIEYILHLTKISDDASEFRGNITLKKSFDDLFGASLNERDLCLNNNGHMTHLIILPSKNNFVN